MSLFTEGKLFRKAGEGSGGGGETGNYLEQYSSMPAVVTPAMDGKIVQYVGETNENYVHGFVYTGKKGGEVIENSPDEEHMNVVDCLAVDMTKMQTFCENNVPVSGTPLVGDLPESITVSVGYFDPTWSGNPPVLYINITGGDPWGTIYENWDTPITTDMETTLKAFGLTLESYEIDDYNQVSFSRTYSAAGEWVVTPVQNAVISVNGLFGQDISLSAMDVGAVPTENYMLYGANAERYYGSFNRAVQYVGVEQSDSRLTYKPYRFYAPKKDAVYDSTVSFEAATLSGTTVSCSGSDFAAFLKANSTNPAAITNGTLTYVVGGDLWVFDGKDELGTTVDSFQIYQGDYETAGFTFTGTPVDGDVVSFTCTVTEISANYYWDEASQSYTPSSVPTLQAANWSNNLQTVNVAGVTATNTVIVAPFPTDAQNYASAGIVCIGQGAGTLTFSCTSVPSSNLQINVVII